MKYFVRGMALGASLLARAAAHAGLGDMEHADEVKKLLALGQAGRARAENLVEEGVAFGQIIVAVEDAVDAVADGAHVFAVLAEDALGKVLGKDLHVGLEGLCIGRQPLVEEHGIARFFSLILEERQEFLAPVSIGNCPEAPVARDAKACVSHDSPLFPTGRAGEAAAAIPLEGILREIAPAQGLPLSAPWRIVRRDSRWRRR